MFATRRLVLAALVPAMMAPLPLIASAWHGPFWAVVVVLVVVASWDLRLGRSVQELEVQRDLPARARHAETFTLHYRIYWSGEVSARVTLLDELPIDLGGDQRLGPLLLAPGGSRVLSIAVTPLRRGRRPLGDLYVLQSSPMGFFVRRQRIRGGQTLPVLPAAAPAPGHALGSRRLLQELGVRPRRPRGDGSEFESLRGYTPDDEPRAIDWRASARARGLVVRQLHVERNHTVIVAIDCGRLMGSHSGDRHICKLDYALDAAVHLTRACARNGDRVGFVAFHRELCSWIPPQAPRRALGAILDATLTLEPQRWEGSYRALTEALQVRQRKRALLVILSDFVEGSSAVELESYLAPLSRRHAVMLVGLRDRALAELDAAQPKLDEPTLFRRLVLQDLDHARQTALRRIAHLGVHTLDLDPRHITAPILNRYLQLREANLA